MNYGILFRGDFMKKICIIFLIFLTACTNIQKRNEKTSTHENQSTSISSFYNEWYGVPYKYGGISKEGIDCSGFVKNLYSQIYNIELPRNTTSQMKDGERINYFERALGDLVFFKTGPNTYHVGVYYENDNFIHASTSKGVMMSNINESYWLNNLIEIRRVVNEK